MTSNFMLKLENLYDEGDQRIKQKGKPNLGKNNLINIQGFLNKFQYFPKMTSVFSVEFLHNDAVYSNEPLLPDMWLRTRSPFDRNCVFHHYGVSRSHRLKHVRKINFFNAPNYFPSFPLNIPKGIVLTIKSTQFEPIPAEKLFSSAGRKKIETTSSIDEKAKGNFLPNVPVTEVGGFKSKTWMLSSCVKDGVFNYGPVSSRKIFLFLKEMYMTMSSTEKEKKRFLVIDISNDIHYQPETVFDILKEEYEKESSIKDNLKPMDVLKGQSFRSRFNLEDRENQSSAANITSTSGNAWVSHPAKKKKKGKGGQKAYPFGMKMKMSK